MTDKFDSVRIFESRILYEKHSRIVVEDVSGFADGSRHEWGCEMRQICTRNRSTGFPYKERYDSLVNLGFLDETNQGNYDAS